MMERHSRYWSTVNVGQRETALFVQGVHHAWQWASPAAFIRWFTDGERRYAKALWEIATVRLNAKELPADYHHLKVWREGH